MSRIICWVVGHDWLVWFPGHWHTFYKCGRCGVQKAEAVR